MDNKCPKCHKKLSIFYLKPNCPYCNCNIVYYDMENRLEEDAKKAEEDYAKLDKMIKKITKIFVPKFIRKRIEK